MSGLAGAAIVTARSTGGARSTDTVEELFVLTGSGVAEETVPVFESVPEAGGVTRMVMVAEAPLTIVGRLHVTVRGRA